MAFEKHRLFLSGKTEEELYEIVDAAMSVAAWRNPEEFQNRRCQIAKYLFSLPEDVKLDFCYQKSSCTMESATALALTEDSAPQVFLNTTTANSPKKIPKKIPATTNPPKPDDDVKFVVSKPNQNVGDRNLGVMSESVASNVKKNVRNNDALIDQKLELSKRKLEERYKQLGERARKTRVLDFAEGKDLIKVAAGLKPNRDVKRPRFR